MSFEQEYLLSDYAILKKKKRKKNPNNPSFRKSDKIKEILREWNTIKDVELYHDFYEVCSQLFLATQHQKLDCLNYYIDYESDSEHGKIHTLMYCEIPNTWFLSLRTRYNLHYKLLQKILNDENSLKHSQKTIAYENFQQISLFS